MAYTTRTFSCWAALLFSLTLLIVDSAAASVTMLGNRVIYPAQAREKTLQFTNDDAAPALIQVWLDKNKLVLLVSNRLKVFYRPEGLPGEGNQAGKQLRIQRNGNALQVSNPTPYYVSISYAKSGNKNLHIEPADMVAPFSQVSWPLGSAFPKGKLKVELGVMNDYGVEVPVTLETPQ